MRPFLPILAFSLLLSGCCACDYLAAPPPAGTPAGPSPTAAPASASPQCTGGSATVDITRNVGGAHQNFRPDTTIQSGESITVDQARIELKEVRTANGIPTATFRYYYAGEFMQEITGSALPAEAMHDLPGTTYGIRITRVTPGTC